MKQDETPVLYQEHPEMPPLQGEAVQHENTTESAVAIGLWLSSKGITAWVAPKSDRTAAIIRLDDVFSDSVFPRDWVLVDHRGNVQVFKDRDFQARFHDASKPFAFPFDQN